MRPIDPAYQDQDDGRHQARRLLVALMIVSGVAYLSWRTTTFSPQAPIASAVFYAMEVTGFLASLLLFFVTGRKKTRTPRRARRGLTVDVLIPTYNEDPAVVRRTVVAAMRIRYPHETWLLDDGNRRELAALARELGCHYLARKENTGAKAGNLNNALTHAKGEFVALFDADHCAEPHFLDRLLGYFDDPDVAFVQTPQDYYNSGSFQHAAGRTHRSIWHEQSSFHHVEQPGRDHHNAATLCGCSCVLRRSHLDRIGGFPETTVTEDMHAAVRLQKLGLKSVYHDEPLAFGVAASDFKGFARQRLRWGEGNMQVCRAEGVPFARELTWKQNLCYLLLSTVYVDAWRRLILYTAPPLTILYETPPVVGEPSLFALFFLPYLITGIAAYYAHFGSFGRIIETEAYSLAKLSSGLLATWGLFRGRIPFRVSSKKLEGSFPWLFLSPVIGVMGLTLLALGTSAYRHLDPWLALWTSLPGWIETVLAILCVYHLGLGSRVLYLAWRAAGVTEHNFEHPLRLPIAIIQRDGARETLWTERISIDHAIVAGECPAFEGDTRDAELILPGRTLPVAVTLVRERNHASTKLALQWHTVANRDDLDQLLHASRWHRVVEARSELLRPKSFLPALLRRRSSDSEPFEPIVLNVGGGARALAYVRETGAASEAILFGTPTGAAEIAASCSGHRDGCVMEILGSPDTVLTDEGALDAVGGRRFHAKIVARDEAQELEPAGRPLAAE